MDTVGSNRDNKKGGGYDDLVQWPIGLRPREVMTMHNFFCNGMENANLVKTTLLDQ